MASLRSPLTIVARGSPAATWFDDQLHHFVALEAASNQGEDGSVTTGIVTLDSAAFGSNCSNDDSTLVSYQAYGIPKGDSQQTPVDSAGQSAFNAAKAQQKPKRLVPEISVSFPLPSSLANEEAGAATASVAGSDVDGSTFSGGETRRIPILAKFSQKLTNGLRFLAMQYSSTLVRIATVEDANNEKASEQDKTPKTFIKRLSNPKLTMASKEEGERTSENHWTIDLSNNNAKPSASKPECLPSNLSDQEKDTAIVGGGVLWNACSTDGKGNEFTSLDLVLVTTTSVITYRLEVTKGAHNFVKSQTYPHDLAACFWHEPRTRTLMVGSYKVHELGSESEPRSSVMEMKTMFLPSKVGESPKQFPSFLVGALRQIQESSNARAEPTNVFDHSESMSDIQDEKMVLPSEVSLLNFYGSVYCIELGSLGEGQGICLTKIDKEKGAIQVRQQIFDEIKGKDVESMDVTVGELDNLLAIFVKSDKMVFFLDVDDIFADTQLFPEPFACHQSGGDSDDGHQIHDLSFLPPHYCLDTSGNGSLYKVRLSMRILLDSIPPTACVVPLLLRREAASLKSVRVHIMNRFMALIREDDMTSLKNWLEILVDQYKDIDVALDFDKRQDEESAVLLSKSTLLELNQIDDQKLIAAQLRTPETTRRVLTQTELLHLILIPASMAAVKEGHNERLRFMSSLTNHYLVLLERKRLSPCPALRCLVITLLWRTGQDAALRSILSALTTRLTIGKRKKQLSLSDDSCPESVESELARSLFLVATSDPFSDKAIFTACRESIQEQLITYSISSLLGNGSTLAAARCLLLAGRLNEAISLCTKAKLKTKGAKGETCCMEGLRSKDFVLAAFAHARELPSVSDRCKAFYHLYQFVRYTWDATSFELETREVQEDVSLVSLEQSTLAHDCGRFPDELFGAHAARVKSLFGYSPLINS